MNRRTMRIILAVLTLPLVLPARTGAAQEDARCFAETGLCISGRIREFWEYNGGLPVFGLPITEQRVEINRENDIPYATQWFERVRMELHSENQRPYDVLLGNRLSAVSTPTIYCPMVNRPPAATSRGIFVRASSRAPSNLFDYSSNSSSRSIDG